MLNQSVVTRIVIGMLGLGLLLAGCRASGAVNALGVPTERAAASPIPTLHSLLSPPAQGTPVPAFGAALTAAPPSGGSGFGPSFGGAATPGTSGRRPTPTPRPTSTPTAASAQRVDAYVEVAVYADKLDPHWSLEQSDKVEYDPFDTSHWYSPMDEQLGLDSGAVSLAVTPLDDFGTLFFTVKPGSGTTYARARVLGVSLWINSGAAILDTDDLSITVVGSNKTEYWSADDYSVLPESDGVFSETRLYYLGLNRAIPPDTWVRVNVWLDDLQFDPIYENVTGFYIKNDADLRTTFYVDNVALLMLP
jgi:hypothetical protein